MFYRIGNAEVEKFVELRIKGFKQYAGIGLQ
jgi:hypothetical protein